MTDRKTEPATVDESRGARETQRDLFAKRDTEIRELRQRLSQYHMLVSNVFTRRGFLEHEHTSAKELLATSTRDRP